MVVLTASKYVNTMKVLLVFSYLIVFAVIIVAVPSIVAEYPDYQHFTVFDSAQAVLLCLLLANRQRPASTLRRA